MLFFSRWRRRLAREEEEREECVWRGLEGDGGGGGSGGGVDWGKNKKKRGGGQAGKQDSDIHALRRGDTDKVSSPPLGQAVITVGPRFQVATLSGTGIIGSRLGATTQPRCGPAMPLSDSEAWL